MAIVLAYQQMCPVVLESGLVDGVAPFRGLQQRLQITPLARKLEDLVGVVHRKRLVAEQRGNLHMTVVAIEPLRRVAKVVRDDDGVSPRYHRERGGNRSVVNELVATF